jgi:DUF971 family protein
LELDWEDGTTTTIPWAALRRACPCATCAGEPGLAPAARRIDDQVGIADIVMAGHYAIQPVWDDGHDTGIYPWAYLWELASNA